MVKTILLSFILITATFYQGANLFAQDKKQAATMPAEILRLINVYRTGKGLPSLKNNELVAQTAYKHSSNMASQKIPFGHDGFERRTAELGKKLHKTEAFAENVAYGARTAQEVVDIWLNSPVHKKNIEGDYELTGIGIAKAPDGTLYFTQIFVSHN